MLYIDQRIGSAEFAKLAASLKIPIEVTTLTWGDMSFLGQGPGGEIWPVGIERKTLTDFVTSYRTSRIWDQVAGMSHCYRDRWVVIEGLYRRGHTSGYVEIPFGGKGKWKPLEIGTDLITHQEFESMRLSVAIKGACRTHRVNDKYQFGIWLRYIYRWWVDQGYDSHAGHTNLDDIGPVDAGILIKPSLMRYWAARLPGIGWSKSMAGDGFPDPLSMVVASEEQWAEKLWRDTGGKMRQLGKAIAAKAVECIRTGKLQ